jgi:signal transduction histidine kinase
VETHPQLTPPPAAGGAPAGPGGKTGAAPTRSSALPVGAVRTLFRQTPVALFGNVVGMLLIAFVYGDVAEPWRLAAWYVPTMVLWLLRLLQWLVYGRRTDLDDATVLRQRWPLAALALAQGAMWGVAAWLFWGVGGTFEKITLLLMLSTYSLGSVQILATQQLLFLPFVSLVFLPAILRVALDTTQSDHLALAGVMLLLFAATVLMGRTYRGALADAVALRLRTEELAAQLAVQKERAEQARAAAETANRAKTQFFAAASHDLRQPLHAMGLFAEALRQRSHDPQVLPLVHSINESVDALEGLFAELLDITRIDSGGIDVQLQLVPLRDVFARLRLHFEPIAFEKGLQLKLRGDHHVAHTDAVVLDRILRNLVSNALRYTPDGGVLVTCRARPEGLLLQVWDSGIGIAPEHLPRVFDEFFQVQRSAVDAAQRKGLGLGLAIVQRLARLLGTQVHVRSRVGHGTVFSLVVPAGQAARSFDARVVAAAPVPAAPTLHGRSIVVVEDDPGVREGLVVLLQGWGAQVQAFDGMQPVQAWLASPAFAPPDLLILDYRLPGTATGLDVLATVRAACGARRVPAIVVSGSTMGGLEAQAAVRDYHLLVKPVLPNKLRAMVSFKLGVR